ncbi:TPA: hypothetical protein VG047_000805 [Streptococcus pyogenes]|nr:hypothetical protein [Streptococcus pyogenes]
MKLKLYNVRDEEAVLAKKWADDNGIEISLTESPLTPETVKEAEGFDGIANAQIGPYIPKNFEGQEITDSLFKALINHPKVIYTPHAAYYTDEAVKNLVEGALNATVEIIKTGTTTTRVN